MNASLNKKLRDVKWGDYRLGDLFEKIRVRPLGYKTNELPNVATNNYNLPALTAGIQNQGLNNFVPRKNATILKNVISISANGANTGATFYQSKDFTVLQDAYAIKWIYSKKVLTDNQYLFIVGVISKAIFGNYEWTNKAGWERIKNNIIPLPQTSDGKIDFDFMESFVAELEAERVAELSAYLKVSGLDNYELSSEEKKVINEYEDIKFAEYDVLKIFDVKNTHNILSDDIVDGSGTIPYLCAGAENNSISSYISYKNEYLEKGNCIFIGGKTFIVTYQERDFFSNDSHNLALYVKEVNANKLQQLYITTCVKKSLSHKYSWGNSVSKAKIKTDKISLPTKDGKPDYKTMELLISAIQKLVIKDVVQLTNRKHDTYKNIVSKSSFMSQMNEQKSMIAASADKLCLDY